MPPAFITALLLTMALGGVTTAALPYIFWRTPQTRFALVVALLVAFALLTLAPLGFPGRSGRWQRGGGRSRPLPVTLATSSPPRS